VQRVRELIHQTDPYEGFPVSEYPHDTQGWCGSTHPAFALLIETVRPARIIEVGTWKGASAIHMGQLLEKARLETEIVCIDTWLGSPGLYTRENDEYLPSLRPRFGYPTLYYTFLANVVRANQQSRITPLALPSHLAAQVLTHFGVTAELIYLDAAHDYESVKSDLLSYWPLVSENGVLFGDDYGTWPGVTKAVNEFSGALGRPLITASGKYVLSNGPRSQLRAVLSLD
jgi:hypothetical protein